MGVTAGSGTVDNPNGIDPTKTTSDKAMKNGHDKENNSSNGSVIKSEADEESNTIIKSKDTIEIGANINVSSKYLIKQVVLLFVYQNACHEFSTFI